jgi:hypothetical protein
MANPEVQLVMKVVSPNKGKQKRLTDEMREFIKKRRNDALEEVLFLKENTVVHSKQISDYWTYLTDER